MLSIQQADSNMLLLDLHVAGTESEVCLAIADGFLHERPCLVLLPIVRVEIREIIIDRGESFQTADVERISFRKLDFLRASDFKSFQMVGFKDASR